MGKVKNHYWDQITDPEFNNCVHEEVLPSLEELKKWKKKKLEKRTKKVSELRPTFCR